MGFTDSRTEKQASSSSNNVPAVATTRFRTDVVVTVTAIFCKARMLLLPPAGELAEGRGAPVASKPLSLIVNDASLEDIDDDLVDSEMRLAPPIPSSSPPDEIDEKSGRNKTLQD